MKCPKCGLENPPTASRCDCGFPFNNTNEKDLKSIQRPFLAKIGLWYLGVTCLIGAIGFALSLNPAFRTIFERQGPPGYIGSAGEMGVKAAQSQGLLIIVIGLVACIGVAFGAFKALTTNMVSKGMFSDFTIDKTGSKELIGSIFLGTAVLALSIFLIRLSVSGEM